jgi:hypothetical protein
MEQSHDGLVDFHLDFILTFRDTHAWNGRKEMAGRRGFYFFFSMRKGEILMARASDWLTAGNKENEREREWIIIISDAAAERAFMSLSFVHRLFTRQRNWLWCFVSEHEKEAAFLMQK